MENPMITFEPTHAQDLFTFWAGLGILLVTVAGMVMLLRKKAGGDERNRNLVGAMLLFFVAMIAGGTALFSWWSQYKTGPVTITTEAISTPYGTVALDDIKNATIEGIGRPSLIDPNNVRNKTNVLIIEEKGGKVHLLSEDHYDINGILGALRQAVQEGGSSGPN